MSGVSTARLVEFLSLVEVGVVRRSGDGQHIEVRRPGSILFDRRDDLGLHDATLHALAQGWVVIAHGTADGTWTLTATGADALAVMRPRPPVEQYNEMGGPMGPPVAAAIPAGRARLTFTPTAPGPSWIVDVADLSVEDLIWRLSAPQRAELRNAVDTLRERLSHCT